MHEFPNLHGSPGCPTQDSPGVNSDYRAVTVSRLTPHSRHNARNKALCDVTALRYCLHIPFQPLKPPLSDLLVYHYH